MKKHLIAILLTSAACTPALADSWQPRHRCSKPIKPYQFTSEWDVRQYKNEIEDYKNCISRFVKSQREEAQNHLEAASDAIKEWNRFVEYEMK